MLVLLLAADIGFVGFDDLALAAERRWGSSDRHGFADAVRHEPRGFVGDAKGALQLLGADTPFFDAAMSRKPSIHLESGMCERSNTVPIVTENFVRQDLQMQRPGAVDLPAAG